jgi:isopentenyl-diphosphate delta-isomerase
MTQVQHQRPDDQILPADQILMACDDAGRFTGQYVRRDLAHTGDGHRHLAVALLLYNSQGDLLLQRRKHAVFDDVWDITGATHPLRLAGGQDEPLEDAALRCLRYEYGIDRVRLTDVGAFTYFAKDPGGFHCENEHCTLYIGEFDGPVRLNDDVGYSCKWVSKAFLLEDMAAAPERYAPWALLSIDLLQQTGFFR